LDGAAPPSSDVLADARWFEPPTFSRLGCWALRDVDGLCPDSRGGKEKIPKGSYTGIPWALPHVIPWGPKRNSSLMFKTRFSIFLVRHNNLRHCWRWVVIKVFTMHNTKIIDFQKSFSNFLTGQDALRVPALGPRRML